METRTIEQVFVWVQERMGPGPGWATERFVRRVSAASERGYELQDYNGHRTSHGYYSSVDGKHTLDVGTFGRIHPDELPLLNAKIAGGWTPDEPWPDVDARNTRAALDDATE